MNHTLPLINFLWDECHCKDVDFQSYDNQVSMKTPFDLKHRDDKWVSIDTCIATEIGYLWNNNIKTLNSCCGHQKVDATAIIDPEYYDAIEKLGYIYYAEAMSGLREYLLKTGHSISDSDNYTLLKDIYMEDFTKCDTCLITVDTSHFDEEGNCN